MLVVDLLHEFELGVWKFLLTHLILILHAASERPGTLVDILNARYVLFGAVEHPFMLLEQVSKCSHVRPVYYTPVSQQRVRDEKTCRP